MWDGGYNVEKSYVCTGVAVMETSAWERRSIKYPNSRAECKSRDLMQFVRSLLHAASHVIPSTASNCVCVKLRLKEVGGLHTDHLQHSFK